MAGLMVDDLFCFVLHNTKASKKEESITLLLETVVFDPGFIKMISERIVISELKYITVPVGWCGGGTLSGVFTV